MEQIIRIFYSILHYFVLSQTFSDSLEVWHKRLCIIQKLAVQFLVYFAQTAHVQGYTKISQYITGYGEKFFEIIF